MLKKIFILFAWTIVSTLLYAQEATSKFSISPFASPTVTRRFLSGTHPVWPGFKDSYNESEKLKPGYSAGVLVSYKAGKNISIQTGVSFTNNGYLRRKSELLYDYQYNGSGLDTTIGVRDGDATHFKQVLHFYFIDIPVYAKYTFLRKKKISVYALTGIEANFNVSNKSTIIFWYDDGKERKTQEIKPNDFRKGNLSVTAGIGIDITFSEKVSLFVQPTYRQMLLSQVKGAPIKRRLYSAGLTTGVSVNI